MPVESLCSIYGPAAIGRRCPVIATISNVMYKFKCCSNVPRLFTGKLKISLIISSVSGKLSDQGVAHIRGGVLATQWSLHDPPLSCLQQAVMDHCPGQISYLYPLILDKGRKESSVNKRAWYKLTNDLRKRLGVDML